MTWHDHSNAPLVSIVLTTLNGARYLRESLDSCLAQTHPALELIVVDGGSTDGTLEILAEYNDPRLRLIQQTNNVGKLPGALNLGLDVAHGQYLTWMQDDCLYHPTALERMVEALAADPTVGHVYADYWVIDEQGQVTGVQNTCEPEQILAAKSDPCGVCFMIRRVVREVVGPHDVAAYPTQDYDYRMRIAIRFRSLRLSEPIFYWRIHPHSLTGSIPWKAIAYNDVDVRSRLGLSTARQARLDRAAIDIAYAFEQYQAGASGYVLQLGWAAVRRNPRYLLNRGVWSILARSFVGLARGRW